MYSVQAQSSSSAPSTAIDFQAIFEVMPEPYLLLAPDAPRFTILGANQARLQATHTTLKNMVGRGLFEAFPDNPQDPHATGMRNLNASLERVLAQKQPDRMAIQKYDILIPSTQSSEFKERYWSPINTPVLNAQGEVTAIIHRVMDVTAFVQAQQNSQTQAESITTLTSVNEQLLADLFIQEQQRNEAQTKLQAMHSQLQATLEMAQIGSWRWNLTTNQVELDETVKRLFEIPPKTTPYTAQDVLACVHPEDRSKVDQAMKRSLEKSVLYDTEFRVTKADHTIRYLAGRGEARHNREGQAVEILGVNWDITARKQLEAERMAALQVAAEQEHQRTEEAEANRQRQAEFIDTICHEIRNPLMGIIGNLDLLQSTYGTLETTFKNEIDKLNPYAAQALYTAFSKGQELINSIQYCADHQKVLINDALDLSKLESLKVQLNPVSFQPYQLISQALQMVKAQAEQKSLQLITDIAPECYTYFQADAHRLLQVLGNLLSNAVKFTQTGTVTVRAALQTRAEHTWLALTVEDTGIGLTPEEQDRLFNRFTQANRRTAADYGGSGLGLAISKRLVELMGGSLQVESQKWRGSRFMFTTSVEILTPKAQRKAQREQRQSEQSHRLALTAQPLHKTILVVEDNAVNQKILVNYLEQRGCLCQVANNGQEALEKAAQFQFDLIFMDLEMPIMGGLEATRRLREKEAVLKHHTPIVGLSGNARQEQMEAALAAGMDTYLTKPYQKTDLYAVIYQYTGLMPLLTPTPSEENLAEPDQPLPWQTLIAQFKQEAALLLEHPLPFKATEQACQLSLDLSPQPPLLTYYFCKLVLQDLKTHLQTIMPALGINELQIINGHLKIQAASSVKLEEVKTFLKDVGILSSAPEAEAHEVSTLDQALTSPVLFSLAESAPFKPTPDSKVPLVPPYTHSGRLFSLKKPTEPSLLKAPSEKQQELNRLIARVEAVLSRYAASSQADPDYIRAIREDIKRIAQGQHPDATLCLAAHMQVLEDALKPIGPMHRGEGPKTLPFRTYLAVLNNLLERYQNQTSADPDYIATIQYDMAHPNQLSHPAVVLEAHIRWLQEKLKSSHPPPNPLKMTILKKEI